MPNCRHCASLTFAARRVCRPADAPEIRGEVSSSDGLGSMAQLLADVGRALRIFKRGAIDCCETDVCLHTSCAILTFRESEPGSVSKAASTSLPGPPS